MRVRTEKLDWRTYLYEKDELLYERQGGKGTVTQCDSFRIQQDHVPRVQPFRHERCLHSHREQLHGR